MMSAWVAIGGFVFLLAGGSAGALAASRLSQQNVSFVAGMVACGTVAIWAWFASPEAVRFLVALALGWCLLVLAAVDWLSFRLPDVLTWPLVAGGFAALLPFDDVGQNAIDHVIGAVVGYGTFVAIRWGYRAWRGREGLGLGDAKLLAAAGAWVGWAPLPSVVLVACAAGFALFGAEKLLRRDGSFDGRIPFGVALCLAIWIVWLYGPLPIA